MTTERRDRSHLHVVPDPEYDISDWMKKAQTEIMMPVIPPMPQPKGIPPEQLTEVTPWQIAILCRSVGALMRHRFSDVTSSKLVVERRDSNAASHYISDSELQISAEYHELPEGTRVNLRPSYLIERGKRDHRQANLEFFSPRGAGPRSLLQPTASRTNMYLRRNPETLKLEPRRLDLAADPQIVTTHQARTAFDILRGSLSFHGRWPEIPPVSTDEVPLALEAMGLQRITEPFGDYLDRKHGVDYLGLPGPDGRPLA